ncbi:outer envelope pore protein 24, chloroplastic-like [Punica granatum]|uniref:Outer envelope pore protein 24, chloroplastic-like n=1 Tax=Punica granatum TaxID=22663 RepID=A0A6P8C578_PUNGR|nr:outer envelope pore protein 24, chloroplastic-like [Punica granatum]
MRASLKGTAGTDKNRAGAASLGVPLGELKLRASITEATVVNGPSLNGLLLSVEKPGSFIIDYDIPKKDFRFQFMNKVKIMEKPLSLTYIHGKGDNRTLLEGTLAFDPCNKLSANYMVGPGNCKLKYSYVHGGLTTFEPSYDLSKNSWDLAVSRKVYGDDVLKATYQTSSRILGLEWSLNSLLSSRAKVSASVNLNEESKIPKVSAETTWNFDM